MEHSFLRVITYVLFWPLQFTILFSMENQTLMRAESERLQLMHYTLNTNKRIGQIATLIVKKHIDESYFPTMLKEVEAHSYITLQEKVTEKSYTCKYMYNPFVLKGLCPANKEKHALSAAFLLMMTKNFNPETERNGLNDFFFEKYDKSDNFKQVDFCVSAKYVESNNYYEYIARFFNKEALFRTIELFDPEALKNS